jgi:hypothetical protein
MPPGDGSSARRNEERPHQEREAMNVPMVLLVHAPDCKWESDTCACTPQQFTDASTAIKAHAGNFKRLQLAAVVPPAPRYDQWVPYERSQARRHRTAISY